MSKTAELLKRVAALEAVVAGIGHNGAFLDDDEPPKRKPALIPDRDVARRYGVSMRTVERWGANPGLGFPAGNLHPSSSLPLSQCARSVGQGLRPPGC